MIILADSFLRVDEAEKKITFTVSTSPAFLKKIKKRASEKGVNRSAYVCGLVSEDIEKSKKRGVKK